MTFAAFGITGDLMRLKILPALYGLHGRGELPGDMKIVGISRREWSDEQLRSYIREIVPHAEESFLLRFTFLQGDAGDPATFFALFQQWADDDVLVYLSLSPLLYKTVFGNMQSAGFAARTGTTKVMIEKPFGTSDVFAEDLYAHLQKIVAEQNIFFVDHYLAKDWVRGLGMLPVAREDIARIHVRFFEHIGVEKRGVLYDQLGALRDVGQNHLLQMVAHILAPNARTEALEQLPTLSSADVAAQTMRAQYDGYQAIEGVAAGSQTETYFKVHTTLNMEGWKGIELTIEGGKALPNSSKEVVLSLKDGSEVKMSEFTNKIAEYEMLLSAAMRGDQTLFPSMREIRAQWRFIDPIVQAWNSGSPTLMSYRAGTMPQK